MKINFPEVYGIDECAFYGVRRDGQKKYGCGRLWDAYKREQLWGAVERSMEKIEQHMGLILGKRFICEEEIPYNWKTGLTTLPTKWTPVLAIGTEAITTLGEDVPLTLRTGGVINDPVVVQVETAATDPCEIYLYHTTSNGGAIIEPSVRKVRGVGYVTDITISGGIATINIPRCHLVDPDLPQPETGYDYNDDTNFVTAVDIVRRYVNPADGAKLLTMPSSLDCSMDPTAFIEVSAGVLIKDRLSGMLGATPATYSGGKWTTACYPYAKPPFALRVSYVAGYNDPCSALCEMAPASLQMAVLKLAHTEMPQGPCGCTIHDESWSDDRAQVENFMPWDVLKNPFGTLVGQVYAYKTLRLFMEGQGGVV